MTQVLVQLYEKENGLYMHTMEREKLLSRRIQSTMRTHTFGGWIMRLHARCQEYHKRKRRRRAHTLTHYAERTHRRQSYRLGMYLRCVELKRSTTKPYPQISRIGKAGIIRELCIYDGMHTQHSNIALFRFER